MQKKSQFSGEALGLGGDDKIELFMFTLFNFIDFIYCILLNHFNTDQNVRTTCDSKFLVVAF